MRTNGFRIWGAASFAAIGHPRAQLVGRHRRTRDMRNLVAAAVFFLAIHFGVSGTSLRARLVRAMGEKAYRGLFSLASLAGLIWLIKAYGDAPRVELWGQLLALKPIAAPLVLLAFLF